MTLDPETGLDAAGYKVRAAQGLDAASAFMPGYCELSRLLRCSTNPLMLSCRDLGQDHRKCVLLCLDLTRG